MALTESLKRLEKEMGWTAYQLRVKRMTPAELAIHYNGLAHRHWIQGKR